MITIFFALAFNLYGLPLTGMEHSLQALCSVLIAIGLINTKFRHRNFKLFYSILVLGPLIRYELLALSVPTIFYLSFIKSDRQIAIFSAIVLITALGLFSFFLFSQSGYFFPSSVMNKEPIVAIEHINQFVRLIKNANVNGQKYGWVVVLFVFTLIATKMNFKLIMVYFSIIFLYLILAKYGWFGRYEVFFVLFVAVTIVLIIKEYFKPSDEILTLGVFLLPFAFGSLLRCTLETPLASSNIYNQQYLVSQFVKELNQPVAVNDLGLISFHSDKPVIDLLGLGSIEAMESRKYNDQEYVKRIMTKNNTNIAIIYTQWFTEKQLESLILIAELTLKERSITPAYPTVSFYANSTNSSKLP